MELHVNIGKRFSSDGRCVRENGGGVWGGGAIRERVRAKGWRIFTLSCHSETSLTWNFHVKGACHLDNPERGLNVEFDLTWNFHVKSCAGFGFPRYQRGTLLDGLTWNQLSTLSFHVKGLTWN